MLTQLDERNTQSAGIVSAARKAQALALRPFAIELGVSHTQVAAFEAGTDFPTRERIAAWITDEREWVHLLGLRLFGIQYRALIQNVLVPA